MSQPAIKNLYQKINSIQKEVRSVFKSSNVSVGQGRSYTAVSHDDVAALLHLPMAHEGVFTEVDMTKSKVEQIITETSYNGKLEKKVSYMAKVWVSVTFVNSDLPSERFVVRGFSFAFDSSDKAMGKALSYAVKNIYLKNFNLESTDNEESRDNEKYLSGQYNENGGHNGHKNSQGSQSNFNQGNQSFTKKSEQESKQASGKESQEVKVYASPAQINAIKKMYGQDFKIADGITKDMASKLITDFNNQKK